METPTTENPLFRKGLLTFPFPVRPTDFCCPSSGQIGLAGICQIWYSMSFFWYFSFSFLRWRQNVNAANNGHQSFLSRKYPPFFFLAETHPFFSLPLFSLSLSDYFHEIQSSFENSIYRMRNGYSSPLFPLSSCTNHRRKKKNSVLKGVCPDVNSRAPL